MNERPDKLYYGEWKMDLEREASRIRDLMQANGLSFYFVDFEVITRRSMVEFGAYILPHRYRHWTFGREYGKLMKFHDLGMVEILEMVINSDPARAYLLESNTDEENKMIIAHVFAHCDFFRNNYWFSCTNRRMVDRERFFEKRFQELEYKHGKQAVEDMLDICMSIQWYVDFYNEFKTQCPAKIVVPRRNLMLFEGIGDVGPQGEDGKEKDGDDGVDDGSGKDKITGPGTVPGDGGGKGGDLEENGGGECPVPGEENDLLRYIIEHAPLDSYQCHILEMIREESLYFYPNYLTKISNEGWATFWHTEMMREILTFNEFDRFAIRHAELMSSRGLNPYKLGYLIFKSIERKIDEREGPGTGRKKILYVRSVADDVSLVREHLNQEIVDECGLYLYGVDPATGQRVIQSTDVEKIRSSILQQLRNAGKPVIVVKGHDRDDEGALHLLHKYDGRPLDANTAMDVLKSLYALWKKPVVLETRVQDEKAFLRWDRRGGSTTNWNNGDSGESNSPASP